MLRLLSFASTVLAMVLLNGIFKLNDILRSLKIKITSDRRDINKVTNWESISDVDFY
jgi:hypothetical protein